MTTAADALNVARSKLGLAEDPPGSNHNEITEWYGMDGAWCDMFVSYCLTTAGIDHHRAWVPYEVDAPADGFVVVDDIHNGQPGDLITYDFRGGVAHDHIGFIEAVIDDGSGYITIEGNWSDKVVRLNRRFGVDPIAAVVRPNYSSTDAPWVPVPDAPPAPEDVPVAAEAAPPFPLPDGSYFGPESGPAESVSGYYSFRDELAAWQTQMQARGWTITPDGYFGPETAGVATAFQTEKGLEVDGRIGPETWAAAWNLPVT